MPLTSPLLPTAAAVTSGEGALRYRVLSLIGKGASARVYEAELLGPWEFRKRVALKVLDVRVDEDTLPQVMSIVNEARLGGQLQHPNLVEIYECGQVGDHPYIAMERIDGASLAQVVAFRNRIQEPLGVEAVVEIGVQVCRGLAYAHGADPGGVGLPLVHRDLKPANLMISRHSVVKVMDFGIARVPGRDDDGLTRGTPLYMSPEQARGDPLGPRSDLFCLGTVLYEAATGKMLFRDQSVDAILDRVARVRLDDRLEALRARHPGLALVVGRCLRPSPKDRYATAAELGAELRALQAQAPLLGDLAELLPHPEDMAQGANEEEPPWHGAGAFTRAFFSRLPEGEETGKAELQREPGSPSAPGEGDEGALGDPTPLSLRSLPEGKTFEYDEDEPFSPVGAPALTPRTLVALALLTLLGAVAGAGAALRFLAPPPEEPAGPLEVVVETSPEPPPSPASFPGMRPALSSAEQEGIVASLSGQEDSAPSAPPEPLPSEKPPVPSLGEPSSTSRHAPTPSGTRTAPGSRSAPSPSIAHRSPEGISLTRPIKLVVDTPTTSPYSVRVTYRALPGGSWSQTELSATAPGRYVCALKPPSQWAPAAASKVEYAIEVVDGQGRPASRFGTLEQPLSLALPPPASSVSAGDAPWGSVQTPAPVRAASPPPPAAADNPWGPR